MVFNNVASQQQKMTSSALSFWAAMRAPIGYEVKRLPKFENKIQFQFGGAVAMDVVVCDHEPEADRRAYSIAKLICKPVINRQYSLGELAYRLATYEQGECRSLGRQVSAV